MRERNDGQRPGPKPHPRREANGAQHRTATSVGSEPSEGRAELEGHGEAELAGDGEPEPAGNGDAELAPALDGGGVREVISRKELARELRKRAYQRAKARRATDPKYLALKEAAKQHRRELYQRAKAQKKEREAASKVASKTRRDRAVASASAPSRSQGDARAGEPRSAKSALRAVERGSVASSNAEKSRHREALLQKVRLALAADGVANDVEPPVER